MSGCNCNEPDIEKLNLQEGDILIIRGTTRQEVMRLGSMLSTKLKEKKVFAIGLTPEVSLEQVDKKTLSKMGLIHKDDTHHTTYSTYQEGGDWLGTIRERIKNLFNNGDSVTWGSEDLLRPEPSIREIEELCAAAVATDRNERKI